MAFFPVIFLLMANLLETPFSNRKVPPVFEQWKIEEFFIQRVRKSWWLIKQFSLVDAYALDWSGNELLYAWV